MSKQRIKMVLVGAGAMGREHMKCAARLQNISYAAIVDKSPECGQKLAEEYGLPWFEDLKQAIEAISPDAADICTPTPLHLPMIRTCADHKVHVLCEKPLARSDSDAAMVRNIKESSGIKIMVAQVIRFWPEYKYVRQIAKDKKYGELLSVDCKRLSSSPGWNSWMLDAAMSGGAAVDLQIHDMDFVYQLLGQPSAIAATGQITNGGVNAVFTQLIYPSNIPVFIEASWLMPKSFPFRMYFQIIFEKAAIEMDSWRPEGQTLKVYPDQGEAFYPELVLKNAYEAEIEYFAHQLSLGMDFDEVPLDEPIASLGLCLASEQACRSGKIIPIK